MAGIEPDAMLVYRLLSSLVVEEKVLITSGMVLSCLGSTISMPKQQQQHAQTVTGTEPPSSFIHFDECRLSERGRVDSQLAG